MPRSPLRPRERAQESSLSATKGEARQISIAAVKQIIRIVSSWNIARWSGWVEPRLLVLGMKTLSYKILYADLVIKWRDAAASRIWFENWEVSRCHWSWNERVSSGRAYCSDRSGNRLISEGLHSFASHTAVISISKYQGNWYQRPYSRYCWHSRECFWK